MPQRRDYIDELKGLGILLVVLGHFIEQYRMGYSFVSASFFCIYAFHMALFCICSGLVARFNPRKLVTQQLWLYLVGQTLMLAFRAAVLRENFAETGGRRDIGADGVQPGIVPVAVAGVLGGVGGVDGGG